MIAVIKMLKHLNAEQSKAVFEHCKGRLAMKECYINIFKVVTDYISKFRSGEWKVAYGYMTVFENVMCRHCFIINEKDEVIDPTIFTASTVIIDRQYITMKIFDDVNEYFEAVEQENYYPALERHLKEYAAKTQEWANKNGFILTG